MQSIEKLAISAIRVLAADGVQKAKSGHPGMPIGAAPTAYAIWKHMRHDPKNPAWFGRDRFVLSSGHASMLEYSLLHLYGYGVTMEDIKSFRQFNSKTPGHPEFGHTVGVEATTGPLGQGFAMAVGMAMAEARMAAEFNKDGLPIVDNYTYVLMGDGCMMEGAVAEAASLAGNLKLNKLIAVYDSNRITIEGSTDITFTENVAARFNACGWQVISVENGEDVDAILSALDVARAENARPTLVIVHTEIAYGTPRAGSSKAHGEPLGEENIASMKAALGWEYEKFQIPAEVYAHFESISLRSAAARARHDELIEQYKAAYADLYKEFELWHCDKLPEEFLQDSKLFTCDSKKSTRKSSGEVLNLVAKYIPNLFGGSADLAGSNISEIIGKPFFSAECRNGSNIHYGVRELAMACAANGIALYGGLRAFCATFFVFSDYVKPALRLSALMHLPVIYILTHDSIGVGEDGPTHQPIEHLAALRAMPDSLTFRPADHKETAYSYIAALTNRMPTVIACSRQDLPQYEATGEGALRGAYILKDAENPELILIASGSEVSLITAAAEVLEAEGKRVRVVSMPCMELFELQSDEYKNSVLPKNILARVSVEAGSTFGWAKYVGFNGKSIGIDRFGMSAPAPQIFEALGLTVDNVVKVAKEVL